MPLAPRHTTRILMYATEFYLWFSFCSPKVLLTSLFLNHTATSKNYFSRHLILTEMKICVIVPFLEPKLKSVAIHTFPCIPAESDITTFSLRKEHFSSGKDVSVTKNLFAVETRPEAVQRLYEAAAKTPVHMMRQLDRYRRDGRRSSRYFLCTPILGGERRSIAKIKHKPAIDIETRMVSSSYAWNYWLWLTTCGPP